MRWSHTLALLPLPLHALCEATLGPRKFDALSVASIDKIVRLQPDPLKSVDFRDPNSHLSKILIPRARKHPFSVSFRTRGLIDNLKKADTANSTQVREYITSTLEALKWHVELDEFEDDTPIGKKKFVNVIATKDPEASRRVVLSAHYDSKWYENAPDNQVRQPSGL